MIIKKETENFLSVNEKNKNDIAVMTITKVYLFNILIKKEVYLDRNKCLIDEYKNNVNKKQKKIAKIGFKI